MKLPHPRNAALDLHERSVLLVEPLVLVVKRRVPKQTKRLYVGRGKEWVYDRITEAEFPPPLDDHV